MEHNSTYYLFDSMTLNERHAWFQTIESPIGNIYVIQYERPKPDMSIETKLFYEDFEKAESYYRRTCKKVIDGKI